MNWCICHRASLEWLDLLLVKIMRGSLEVQSELSEPIRQLYVIRLQLCIRQRLCYYRQVLNK
jgi:hypothetical protein